MAKLISWVEIPVANIQRAVKFYNAVLGISLEVLDFGKEKMACFPNNEGAISEAPEFKPSKDGTIISFNVDEEMDMSLEKVIAAGGRIITPKTKIEAEGKGYFSLILDSEGNRLGLHSEN